MLQIKKMLNFCLKKPGFDMIKIIEKYLMSKSGNPNGGEDRLILGHNFYGVVDGATDKSGNNWGTPENPKKGGEIAADIIKSTLEDNVDLNLTKLVNVLNKKMNNAAGKANININDVKNLAGASFAAYVHEKNLIYHIGDCNFVFVKENGELEEHYNEIAIDKLTSELRSRFIMFCYENKIDPFIDGKDLGREYILWILKKQTELGNRQFRKDYNGEKEWILGIPYEAMVYKTINGLHTELNITPVPEGTKEIILTSDGFNVIKPTLKETLGLLKKQLKDDPHCIGLLKSTKGLGPGNINYDDMAYLRLKIN